MEQRQRFQVAIGSQRLDLPVVPLHDDLAVALLITVDHGVHFCELAGQELAERLEGLGVEVVCSVATMGIPLAIEVTRALGLDDYAIVHKTKKIHLADGEWEPVRSITTEAEQSLGFDRARLHAVATKRVAIVDDVISTGGSIRAASNLVRRVGGEVVALGCLATEGTDWIDSLGPDASLVVALGSLPLFGPSPEGFVPRV